MEHFSLPEKKSELKTENTIRAKTRKFLKNLGVGAAMTAGVFASENTQAQSASHSPKDTIFTADAYDARTQAYADSSTLHGISERAKIYTENVLNKPAATSYTETAESVISGTNPYIVVEGKKYPVYISEEDAYGTGHNFVRTEVYDDDQKIHQPEGYFYSKEGGYAIPKFSQPVQPVVYDSVRGEKKEVETLPVLHTADPNDPRIEGYKDSLIVHEVQKKLIDSTKAHPEWYAAEDIVTVASSAMKNPRKVHHQGPVVYRHPDPQIPEKKDIYAIPLHLSPKPVQPVEYQNPELADRPNSYPVYGPSGGLLGLVDENGTFSPLGVENRAHLADGLGVHAKDKKILEEWDAGVTDSYLVNQGVRKNSEK